MPTFTRAETKTHKYSVITPSGRKINFGHKKYKHYKDTTGLGLYSHMNHLNKDRRKSYLARAKGIRDAKGMLTYKNKEKPNYYAIKYLWSG